MPTKLLIKGEVNCHLVYLAVPIIKLTIGVVKSRLMDHLTSNSLGLLNSHQSAYCKHHSTETALLYIHDYLISAMGSQKISCLCLLVQEHW